MKYDVTIIVTKANAIGLHNNKGLYLNKDRGLGILNQSVFNSEYILMSIKFPLDFSYCLRVPSNVK